MPCLVSPKPPMQYFVKVYIQGKKKKGKKIKIHNSPAKGFRKRCLDPFNSVS